MKTQTLPVVILNEGNLDFIFDLFDREDYQVGLGPDPGYENSIIRESTREGIERWNVTTESPAISYVEIDPIRKRYIPLTKWFENTEKMRKFLDENVNQIYSEPIDYWGGKYDMNGVIING